MNIYFNAPAKNKKIAVTFDDGPHPSHTQQILETLNSLGAKATFFVTGANAVKNKNLVLEISKLGHEIGNHSFDHPKKLFSMRTDLLYQIRTANDILEDITGKKVTLYRPPFGLVSPFLFSVCNKLALKIIFWNINSHDYRRENERTIADRVLKKLKPGSIILFHECHFKNQYLNYQNTTKALGIIFSNALFKSIKPVTVTDLFEFQENS